MSKSWSDREFERMDRLLVDVLKLKAKMIELGITQAHHSCNMPKCSGRWQLSISGKRNHIHMACNGACGQTLME